MNAPLGAAPERIWLAVEAVDMRLGIHGVSARIQGPHCSTGHRFSHRRRSGDTGVAGLGDGQQVR